jgi:hypothetical protein
VDTRIILALLASNLLQAQINPKVWNLIGPDDKLIFGVDRDHYRHSAISSINGTPHLPSLLPADTSSSSKVLPKASR